MILFDVINQKTYPRIFQKAFEEGKKIISMHYSLDIMKGQEYTIKKI